MVEWSRSVQLMTDTESDLGDPKTYKSYGSGSGSTTRVSRRLEKWTVSSGFIKWTVSRGLKNTTVSRQFSR